MTSCSRRRISFDFLLICAQSFSDAPWKNRSRILEVLLLLCFLQCCAWSSSSSIWHFVSTHQPDSVMQQLSDVPIWIVAQIIKLYPCFWLYEIINWSLLQVLLILFLTYHDTLRTHQRRSFLDAGRTVCFLSNMCPHTDAYVRIRRMIHSIGVIFSI